MEQPQRGRGRGNLRGAAGGAGGAAAAGGGRPQPDWKQPRPQMTGAEGNGRGEPAGPSSSAAVTQRGGNGGGNGDATGRGAMRGKRPMPEVVVTRLPNAASKQGVTGSKLVLKTNYFRLNRKEKGVVFQYRIDFDPPVDDSRVIHALLRVHGPAFGPYIFEGTMLFLYNKLKSETMELQVKDPRTDILYKMTVRHVGTVDMASEQAMMILNLMHRQAMASLKLLEMNRHFFDPVSKIAIPQYGLELYPGYVTSIRQHEQDIMLCIEVTHRVLRTETCYNALQNMMRNPARFKDQFKSTLIGSVVMSIYNQKTYKITDVDFETTPSSTFSKKDGTKISFVEYFKQQYNIQIRDPKQPMLVSIPSLRMQRSGVSGPIMLVPELCRLTGITNDMRKDFNLMRAISDHTRIGADKRIERLQKFNTRLQETKESKDVFKYWNTELDRRLVEVPARTLPQENIIFRIDTPGIPAGSEADWSSAFRNNRMYKSVPLNNWFVVCPRGQEGLINDFLGCMVTAAKGVGFIISHPQTVLTQDTYPKTYGTVLSDLVNKDPQLIMCVVPNDDPQRYSSIKKKCCVDRAIATQVIKARTITPKGGNPRTLMSVATKVAIQLNCKLGGVPWIVKNPLSSVMVVGFDVCHDPNNKSKSYGALVATMYAPSGGPEPRYFSSVEAHNRGEELSSFISTNIVKALRAYQQQFGTGVLPRRILMYRDGVGEGQLGHVVRHEVNAIKKRLAEVYVNSEFKSQLTIVVVNKRINTRLFMGGRNPPPGTVVDDIITMPERTDFYLISQSVRQGTVSPTGYNVVYDESGLRADQLQVYTSKQTHLYFNWCGSVGVPAVCQYAHKLAFLTSQYLHQQPHQQLENRLYYL